MNTAKMDLNANKKTIIVAILIFSPSLLTGKSKVTTILTARHSNVKVPMFRSGHTSHLRDAFKSSPHWWIK